MADNALKTPLTQTIGNHTDRRANDFSHIQPKGLPCTVTKVEKDIITVKFEGSNGVWTMPTMKMTQAFSPYGRDPTQVGDKGYASPSDYYLGGMTDLGGGSTNYSPRGNLTPLVFHPISRTGSEKRDYDQYTGAGGPNGVKWLQTAKQPKSNQTPPNTPAPQMLKLMLGWGRRSRQAWADRAIPAPLDDQQDDQRSYYEMNKDGRHAMRSKTGKVSTTVDEQSSKIALRAPADGGAVFVGGNGVDTGLYGPIIVASPWGLMVTANAKGKWQHQDEKDELDPASGAQQ